MKEQLKPRNKENKKEKVATNMTKWNKKQNKPRETFANPGKAIDIYIRLIQNQSKHKQKAQCKCFDIIDDPNAVQIARRKQKKKQKPKHKTKHEHENQHKIKTKNTTNSIA